MITKTFFFRCCLLACLLFGCTSTAKQAKSTPLSKINIIDRNGLSQTISAKDRLRKYEDLDFTQPLPYQKVMRVFEKNTAEQAAAVITTYHENGLIKQWLEVHDSRACGRYREWFDNGTLKIEAMVIGGIADVTPAAQNSWLFDSLSRAWDDKGNLAAEFLYHKGKLKGISRQFYEDGKVLKEIPFNEDHIDGVVKEYTSTGTLIQQTPFSEGIQEGLAIRYWELETNEKRIAAEELFKKGKLLDAKYYDPTETLVSEIKQGCGKRALFSGLELAELQEYRSGEREGLTQTFDEGRVVKSYGVKDGLKHGEEIEYYFFPGPEEPEAIATSKISVHWQHGKIHGLVKTWYPNGQMQSQREMSNNVKNGISTAWYRDGCLMLMETYRQGKLMRGEYLPRGQTKPESQIENGRGTCTLFDPEGNFLQRITYEDGEPA